MSVIDLLTSTSSITLLAWLIGRAIRDVLNYRIATKALDKADAVDVPSVVIAHHGRVAMPPVNTRAHQRNSPTDAT